MSQLRWTRTPSGGWRSGDFEIVVTGETATGRPVLWALKHKGEWIMPRPSRMKNRYTVQRLRLPRQFDRLRDAKREANNIHRLITCNLKESKS